MELMKFGLIQYNYENKIKIIEPNKGKRAKGKKMSKIALFVLAEF